MGECSTSMSQNCPPEPERAGCIIEDYTSDSDGGPVQVIDEPPTTASITRWLIISPERHTDPGSETEYSFQEEETDLCCRSTETSSSEWSERNAVGHVEFEIRSPNEGPNPFGDSSTASDASVNELQVIGLPPPKVWDDKESSSCVSSGSSDVFDPEIPRRDYWTCLQCSNVNNRPAFRYCEKCYKVRRDMYQPRVKPRKKRKRKSSKVTATARKFTLGKAKTKSTTDANKSQLDSAPTGDAVKSCETTRKSPVAFHGIKLESCSQENRDSGLACSQSSGVGCSQSTVASGSGALASNKDSDSSLSPDSGADTRSFHGIKLSSTRLPVSSLALDLRTSTVSSLPRTPCLSIDQTDTVCPSTSGVVDEVHAVRSSVFPNQGTDEVDTVILPKSGGIDEVDAVGPSVAVKQVDTVCPSTSGGVDEVDTVQPSMFPNRGIDEVDTVRPGKRGAVDEVDAVRPRAGVDQIGTVCPSTSRGVDEVDTVHPSMFPNRGVDEVDTLRPAKRQCIDKVGSVNMFPSNSVDEVDTLQRDFTQCVDDASFSQYPLSQSVKVDNSACRTSSRTPDKVDLAPSATAQDVNQVSTLRLHSVKTQTDLCFISKSDIPKEKPSVDVEKCMTCYSRSLDGIFVHSKYAHVCCCYKCTVRVWKTTKRCPLCNCKVMNVLRLFKGC